MPGTITQAADQAARPMRWQEATQLAARSTRKVLDVWDGFERDFLRWMPGGVSYQEAAAGGKSAPSPVCSHDRCDHGHEHHQKRFTPDDLRRLRGELIRYFEGSELAALDQVFQTALDRMMVGGGRVQTDGGVWNQIFSDGWEEGGAQAYRDARRYLRGVTAEERARFADAFPEIQPINEASTYAKDVYLRGFATIRDKVTVFFRGEAMDTMLSGLTDGLDWKTIARNIHRRVGVGASWHWQRLVRTELVRTFDRASDQRYAEFGIQYVRFSINPTACPICRAIRSQNSGYYLRQTAPRLPDATHPNCRCRWLPVWRLPEGVRV